MADIQDGESIEIKGSAKKPYVIKNVGGAYSCTCPAWRNQSLATELRTCKHIRKLRGDDAEKERVGNALPLQSTSKSQTQGPPLLLAHRWENDVDLGEWWMSEKLDGVRAYWDGQRFISRQGNEYLAPEWFVHGLPQTPLDGELWVDRKAFQRTVSIVRRKDKSDDWKKLQYVVFDAPSLDAPFEERLTFVEECAAEVESEFIKALKHQRCKGLDHLRNELDRVELLGGEGLMLREPGSRYEIGRSTTLLKVKTFHDDEATVIDHVAGKGRHRGRMGAIVVRTPDGTEFSVGTGFTDKQREAPPKIGDTITFRFQELTDGGVPRFPSFVRFHKSVSQTVESKQEGTRENREQQRQPMSNSIGETNSLNRYFEFSDSKSSKFWEISIDGLDVTVRYGRIGSKGQTKTTTLTDEESAQTHADRLVDQKISKGYIQC